MFVCNGSAPCEYTIHVVRTNYSLIFTKKKMFLTSRLNKQPNVMCFAVCINLYECQICLLVIRHGNQTTHQMKEALVGVKSVLRHLLKVFQTPQCYEHGPHHHKRVLVTTCILVVRIKQMGILLKITLLN